MLRKIISIILCLFMVAGSVIPQKSQPVYAIDTSMYEDNSSEVETAKKYQTTTDEDFDISTMDIESEVVSRRTSDSKTFKRVDGTYVLAMYDGPVHYYENDEWKDIDNSLLYNELTDEYENQSSIFTINFPKEISENKKFKLSIDNYQINWSIPNIDKTEIIYSIDDRDSSNIKELSNVNQQATYNNIQNGVNLEYLLSGNQIKENIVLEKYIENYQITFNYEVKDLVIIQDTDGSYSFVNDLGIKVFDFDPLIMSDSEGNISYDIRFELEQIKKDTYSVTLIPDDEFLKTAEYPLIIDPSISSSDYEVSIYDTYLRHSWLYGDTNYYSSSYIYCDDGDGSTAYLGYLNFRVPTYLDDYDITFATLNITTYSTADGRLYLHELPSYTSVSSLTWTNKPIAGTDLIDFADITDNYTTYQLDITSSVDKWNEQSLTYMPGFELKSDGALLKFYSMQYSSMKPVIEIGFIDSNGIKDYWTYNSQDISFAGTGYISDYTQDLYIIRKDINFQTDLQTLGVSFAYNNNMATSSTPNIGYGNGWNINYNLTLYEDSPNVSYYTVDYTGNRTYYYPTQVDPRLSSPPDEFYHCYISEDGPGNKLVWHYLEIFGGTPELLEVFILTKDNTKYEFEDNYLSRISSLNNNLYITINRDPSNLNHVESVSDYRGNMIDLNYYGTNGNLESATLKSKDDSSVMHNLEKIYYRYYSTTNFLHDIYYLTDYNQDGDLSLNLSDLRNVDKIVRYDHYTSDQLYKAYVKYIEVDGLNWNESIGEEIRYHYISSSNNAISYLESYFNSYKFSQINYNYEAEQTMITDHTGDFVLYKFDNYGHTVNIIDSDSNALYYEYIDIFADSSIFTSSGNYNYELNHQIVNQSSPQKAIYNPIENYSFEDDLNGWYTNLNYGAWYVSSFDDSVTGESSLRITTSDGDYGYARQLITLDEGVYNLSVDVKNDGEDTDNVYVYISGLPSQYIPNDGEWHRLTFTINISSPNTTKYIYLYSFTTGYVYFDNLVLYEDFNSTRVNLVDNPSFEHGITGGWTENDINYNTTTTLYSINDGTGALNDLYEDILGEYAVGLNGEIYTTLDRNYLEDMMDSNGSIFVGGWATRYTAPHINNANLIDGKVFRIYVQQLDNDYEPILGTETAINFNLSYDSWQYVYREIIIAEECEHLVISFQYLGEGEVIVDGMSVFYKASSTSYTYDDYGRIEKVYQGHGTVYEFTYPENDEGISIYPNLITDQHDNVIDIEQQDGELISVTRNNVTTSPTYDPAGTKLITGYSVQGEGEEDPYFTTSTSYNHNSQYLYTSTDEFEKTTTYYTDVVTGLLEHIENSKNVDTNYEYYDNGLLRKVYIDNSNTNETSYVEYVYDEFNKLVEIHLGSNYFYKINYDSLGRVETVQVNNQTLMSYDYLVDTYETSKLSEQEYGNGDTIYFGYDDDNEYITEIQFQASGGTPETRFTYQYDSLGRVSVYHDSTNNITEEYEYDLSGNLVKIEYNNGDSIEYSYDEDGNLIEISCDISDYNSSTNYYYNESIANSELYDKTTYKFDFWTFLVKEYIYEDDQEVFDPLGRLQKVQYSSSILGIHSDIFDVTYDYEDYTSRVLEISYHFQEANTTSFQYVYEYDELGNITREEYNVFNDYLQQYVSSIIKTFDYDDLNQLIEENSRDVSYMTTQYSDTNYTKYYHYDQNGNITEIKSMKYGEDEYTEPSIPGFYEQNYDMWEITMRYNNFYDYQDIYNLDIGESPSLTFRYFDAIYYQDEIYGLTTTMTGNTLDTSTPGYYYRDYSAGGISGIDLEFRIVFKVGNPEPIETTPQEKVSLENDDVWLDQLESYDILSDGVTTTSEIGYDNQGNPVEITNFYYDGGKRNHAVLVWEGRQLVEIKIYTSSDESTLGADIWYTYNDSGIRMSKIVDDMIYNTKDRKYIYSLSGDVLISEVVYAKDGSSWVDDYQIAYIYDYDGSLIGFKFYDTTGTTNYLYIKNLQGDITKIVEEDGTVVVEYYYDAYGNIVNIEGSLSTTIGVYNSFRYRSYKFDSEINMYYLNSRYYNPEIGRFISSDATLGEFTSIRTANMYSYCMNNPIMYVDPNGESAILVLIIVAVILFTPVGGTLAQVATSVLSYAAMAAWALGDLVFNEGNGAWADMNRIGWNPFNADESAVFKSSNISFYKGVPVFLKDAGRSGSFYFISLNRHSSFDVLKHERGHNYQAMMMGIGTYGLTVGIPSWKMWGPWAKAGNYYGAPWETMADILGGVTTRTHTREEIVNAWLYYGVSSVFFPASYLFLL